MPRNLLIGLLVFFSSMPSFAATAEERAQAAIEARQGLLKVVGQYFGPLVGMARGQIPYDADIAAKNAKNVSLLLPMIPDLFAFDTRASGFPSDSLDGVWENPEDFATKAMEAAKQAEALAAVAGDGRGALGGALSAAGGACKSCHDDYRQKQ